MAYRADRLRRVRRQKVVSKAEGRTVHLDAVTPSERAARLARVTGRDARLCQLYLDESKAIIDVRGRHHDPEANRPTLGHEPEATRPNAQPDLTTLRKINPMIRKSRSCRSLRVCSGAPSTTGDTG